MVAIRNNMLPLFCFLFIGLTSSCSPSSPIITPVSGDDFACWAETSHLSAMKEARSEELLLLNVNPLDSPGLGLVSNIYSYNLNTNELKLLVSNSGLGRGVISSSGQYFYYIHHNPKKNRSVQNEPEWYVYDLRSDEEIPLLIYQKDNSPEPTWSADGKCLMSRIDNTVWAYNLDTRSAQRKELPTSISAPSIYMSPSAKYWAWLCNENGVCAVDDKWNRIGNSMDYSHIKTDGYIRLYGWSPDGRTFGYTYTNTKGLPGYVDTFSFTRFGEQGIEAYWEYHGDRIWHADWSPDGRRLLIIDAKGVTLHDTDKQSYKELKFPQGYTDRFTWSSTGDAVIYVTTDGTELVKAKLDGSDHKKLPLKIEGHISGVFRVP